MKSHGLRAREGRPPAQISLWRAEGDEADAELLACGDDVPLDHVLHRHLRRTRHPPGRRALPALVVEVAVGDGEVGQTSGPEDVGGEAVRATGADTILVAWMDAGAAAADEGTRTAAVAPTASRAPVGFLMVDVIIVCIP